MEQVGFVAGYLPLPENLTVRESLEIFAGFYGIRRPGAVVTRGHRALRRRAASPSGGARSCPRVSARWSAS